MVYAVMSSSGDREHILSFLCGTEREIMDQLIENAEMLIDAYGNGMSIEALQDEYYCEFNYYMEFKDSLAPVTVEDLKMYKFALSDSYDTLYAVSNNLSECVRIFNENPPIRDLCIKVGLTEKDLDNLKSEFESFEGGDLQYNDWLHYTYDLEDDE